MTSDTQYLSWHKKISANKAFGWFWTFCGVYAVLFYFFAVASLVLVYHNFKAFILCGIAGVFTRYVVCEVIHFFRKKPHPYQRLNFSPPKSILFSFLDQEHDAFPSEHASTSMAISVILFGYSAHLGIAGFIFSIVMGIGRIVLGYHEVEDVVMGWIVGLISGALVLYLGLRFW